MTQKDQVALVKQHVAKLNEHFDSVQIFVTKMDGADTVRINIGEGNWCARYGHVKLWVQWQDGEAARGTDADDVEDAE